MSAWARAGGAWLALLVLCACSNDLNALYRKAKTDAGAGNAADAGVACGLPFGTSACVSCASTNCCGESTACSSSPACAAYETCLADCRGDPHCRSQCTAANRIGAGSTADVSALGACLVEHCAAECSLSCGSIAAYVSPPATAGDCQDCVAANSCDYARACGSSADCDAYLRCILGCPTVDCRQACATMHDAGARTYQKFANDYAGVCATSCSYGGNWSCVGHVTWPAPHSKTTTITLEGVHEVGPTPKRIAAAEVSFCLLADTDCNAPLAQALTDASGSVSLEVTTVQGNEINQAVLGFFRTTASGYAPAYMYYGFPFTEGVVTFSPAESPWLAPVDMATGSYPNVHAGVLDCLDSAAAGVRIDDDSPATGYPTYNTTVSIMGTPGEDATDRSGFAMFFDVPVGPLVVTATPVALGKPSSTVSVDVRTGAVTEVALWPTP